MFPAADGVTQWLGVVLEVAEIKGPVLGGAGSYRRKGHGSNDKAKPPFWQLQHSECHYVKLKEDIG